jgi:uncharacterized protein (DUF2237 family)
MYVLAVCHRGGLRGRRTPRAKFGIMNQINVLGTELQPCSFDPMTGYYRTGCCENRGDDPGLHVVCIVATDEFLAFSASVGNDLATPMPQYGFPGLKAGDQWCLCASRWQEAFDARSAPQVRLESTHVSALEYSSLADLRAHAVDAAS